MYCIKRIDSKQAIIQEGTANPPFGPTFSQEQVDQADRLEVWGSSFTDAGEDFCEYRLFEKGQQIATKRVAGF